MLFVVESDQKSFSCSSEEELYPYVVLRYDNFNDYGYKTLCEVHVHHEKNLTPDELGKIRIMHFGQKKGEWVFAEGPKRFKQLDNSFCSLANFGLYDKLKSLGEDFAVQFLKAIRDAAYNSRIWNSFSKDPCFMTSLLRETSTSIEMRDVIPEMFGGNKRKLISKFTFKTSLPGVQNAPYISFDFRRRQSSTIPHRIMLLVGTNGAGKTQLLSKLAIALSGLTEEEGVEGQEKEISEKRISAGFIDPIPSFYGIVAISFNAFDRFEIPNQEHNALFSYTYCGMRRDSETLHTEKDLIDRIQTAIKYMDDDRLCILNETIKNVLGVKEAKHFFSLDVSDRYQLMSAGQRIVLNILSHLIANLKERTLILFDEPETHLHPSLMTTLLTEISMLLDKFKSFAVFATHSPIIAQQIPSQSIRVLSRQDDLVEVTMPDIECFGENLSEISNALFETREYERDYTSIIDTLLKANNNDPNIVEKLFEKGLGSNARIYLWASARSWE
jgi:predicted ATPase